MAAASCIILLNDATETELKRIPQIGPILAKRILQNMPLKSWAEVKELDYIGPERTKSLQKFFVIKEDDAWEEISQANEKAEDKGPCGATVKRDCEADCEADKGQVTGERKTRTAKETDGDKAKCEGESECASTKARASPCIEIRIAL